MPAMWPAVGSVRGLCGGALRAALEESGLRSAMVWLLWCPYGVLEGGPSGDCGGARDGGREGARLTVGETPDGGRRPAMWTGEG
ncbi:hypothetical protein DMB42_33185 [Nonomuraea sp. WAC 01424]|nr:hypothetical protein DMB42_33185 [Nonomuraea sp. WAC 01424]